MALSINVALQTSTIAQIIPDGTLSTTVTTTDNRNFMIEDGGQAGSNLFHSFEKFSIPTNGSAQFNNASDITTIIGRVTGARPSVIDGLMSAQGDADLFLINPQGITFGPNAQLDIGGSFLASTAEQIFFEDGVAFHAGDTTPSSLLTVTAPVGLQMGESPQSIVHQANVTQHFGVTDDNTLSLIGGNIQLDGGALQASTGRIDLRAIGPTQQISLRVPTSDDQLNTHGVNRWGDITLINQATIDVAGDPSGGIYLKGDRIHLSQDSHLQSLNTGNNQGQAVRIVGNEIIVDSGSSIFALAFGNGPGASITLDAARRIQVNSNDYPQFLRNLEQTVTTGTLDATELGTTILTVTAGTARAGDIKIQAPSIEVLEGGALLSTTLSSGATGSIELQSSDAIAVIASGIFSFPGIQATDPGGAIRIEASHLTIQDGGSVGTSSLGAGPSGNILIDASTIDLIDTRPQLPRLGRLASTGINSIAFGEGAAGNVNIETERLRLLDGAGIFTLSIANLVPNAGTSGNIRIKATDSIEVSGYTFFEDNQLFFSNIDTATGSSSDAGDILIHTGRLLVDGGQISSDTFGAGDGGDLSITATEHITVAGDRSLPIEPLLRTKQQSASGSGLIFTSSFEEEATQILPGGAVQSLDATGQAGNLQLSTPRLTVRDFGGVTASSSTPGNAGALTVKAGLIHLDDNGNLLAGTIQSDGGNIFIELSEALVMQDGSFLSAQSRGSGNGGNITLRSPFTIAMNNSDIAASAVEGNGGRIEITTQGLFGLTLRDGLTPDNDITVSSTLGLDGTIEINSPDIDPHSQTLELSDALVDISQLMRPGCALDEEQFVLAGRGGLPNSPQELINSDRPWFDLRDPSAFLTNLSDPVASSPAAQPVPPALPQEATGMAIAPNGRIQLTTSMATDIITPQPPCISRVTVF